MQVIEINGQTHHLLGTRTSTTPASWTTTPFNLATAVTTFVENALLASTTPEPPHTLVVGWPSVVLIIVMAVLSVLTVVGNLIVLLSFILDKSIRQPSNYFIFSLAVSDLIIGLEGFPIYTYFFINDQRWPFGAFVCDLWLSIDYSSCLASIYTVLGITVDRYCSVKYPAAYRNWRTQSRVLIIVALTWIIPSLLFSISIFGYGFFSGRGRILKPDECYVQFMTNAWLNAGMYISYYWSTLFLMLYLYYGIYSAAKDLAKKSDQKHKRLALLSDMRNRVSTRKEAPSVMGMSEVGVSNSGVESPHSSDSFYQKANNKGKNNSLNTVTDSGHVYRARTSVEPDTTTGCGAVEKSTLAEKEQTSAPFPSTSETIEIERELTTGAFQPETFPAYIDDDFPFIDEGNGSNAGSVRQQPISIENREKEKEREGIIINIENDIKTSANSLPPITANGTKVQALQNEIHNAKNSIDLNANHNSNCIAKTDRPDPFKENNNNDTRRLTLNSTLAGHRLTAAVDVVVEKAVNGPVGVRRLLTAMRHHSARVAGGGRTENRKRRKAAKSTQSRSENRARKALRTITIILGSFTVFWTPFYVLATIYGFCESCISSPNFNLLYTISYYLCYMNSPLNPICYAMANQQFKRAFKRILRGDLRRM
ncbi:7 transmembrane receptor (rhodopsin family) domain-containing protein [Ditylenchus destructor]|nr:7 transmembrane receptor (rhodopsin family) domain-containing protein [Ditylenchus destructor]